MTVLTFGEALLRLSLPTGHLLEDLAHLDVFVGGAELNVAVGLARLGTPAAWFSAIPGTPLGQRVQNELRAAGVNTAHVLQAEGRLGTYYLEDHLDPRPSRALYDRTDSSFSRMTPEQLPAQLLSGVTWVHVTGISLAVSQPARLTTLALLHAAKTQGCQISVDVNHRRLLLADDRADLTYRPALELADLIFCAERDAPLLLSGAAATPQETLKKLHARFPHATVVITRGPQGSAACTPAGETAHCDAITASGPGRIGRGDAFCAAFLHRVQSGAPLADCLAFAAAAAALKTTTPGDQLRATEAQVTAVLGQRSRASGEPHR